MALSERDQAQMRHYADRARYPRLPAGTFRASIGPHAHGGQPGKGTHDVLKADAQAVLGKTNRPQGTSRYPGLRPVVLTEAEREWLGRNVQLEDGRQGQVWALSPTRSYVWVVLLDGQAVSVHTSDLTKLTAEAVQDVLA